MATVNRKKLLRSLTGCTETAFVAAGAAWHSELAKYPPQRGLRQNIRFTKAGRLMHGKKTSDVAYKRTGTLARKARGRIMPKEVELGGVIYTPYVIATRKTPASHAGQIVWPGKLDAAEAAAIAAFKTTFLVEMLKP